MSTVPLGLPCYSDRQWLGEGLPVRRQLRLPPRSPSSPNCSVRGAGRVVRKARRRDGPVCHANSGRSSRRRPPRRAGARRRRSEPNSRHYWRSPRGGKPAAVAASPRALTPGVAPVPALSSGCRMASPSSRTGRVRWYIRSGMTINCATRGIPRDWRHE